MAGVLQNAVLSRAAETPSIPVNEDSSLSSVNTTNWRHTEQEVNCDAPVCIVISYFSIPNKTGKKNGVFLNLV